MSFRKIIVILLIIFTVATAFYDSDEIKNEGVEPSHSSASSNTKQSPPPSSLANSTTHNYPSLVKNESHVTNASNKSNNQPEKNIEVQKEKVVEVVGTGWSEDGEVAQLIYNMNGESVRVDLNGVPSGTERGYNLAAHGSQYYEYESEVLSELADANDKIAQLVYGSRLITQGKNFELAEKHLMRAARQGFTAAYEVLSQHFAKNENYTSSYAYKFLMEKTGDENIRSHVAFMAIKKKLTEQEVEQSKIIAEKLGKSNF